MHNYNRAPVAFVRGEGARLWDAEGAEYLDFLSGIAVTNLGHAHPAVTRAITEQAGRILHTSNLYYIAPQVRVARLLCEHSFGDKVFFCNSGAEANEAALKLARKVSAARGRGFEVISARGGFHGRTLFTLSATGQEKIHAGFYPLVDGFHYVPFGDADALEAAVTARVGAVLLEPIQGESGVIVPPEGYLKRVREICDRHELVLIFDEVQTGMGRTGTLWAYEASGAAPDLMTLAKGLGNGTAIGALVATEAAAEGFTPGDHGSTFGGNHLASAAAEAVLRTMTAPGFLESVRERAEHLARRLDALIGEAPGVVGVRGRGMMRALVLDRDAAPVAKAAMARRLLTVASGKALRLLPPLIIDVEQIDRGVELIRESIVETSGTQA
ncbi:MAG: aspartate aminotransferase family protein [Myxococcales bacterium]|nr:aspartate aminotransferase family protein [Myxococcales bacterium]